LKSTTSVIFVWRHFGPSGKIHSAKVRKTQFSATEGQLDGKQTKRVKGPKIAFSQDRSFKCTFDLDYRLLRE